MPLPCRDCTSSMRLFLIHWITISATTVHTANLILIIPQVLHTYLEDDSIAVDNDTAVKLGCLELRRFYKDMPQIALKRKENFTMLEWVIEWHFCRLVSLCTRHTVVQASQRQNEGIREYVVWCMETTGCSKAYSEHVGKFLKAQLEKNILFEQNN